MFCLEICGAYESITTIPNAVVIFRFFLFVLFSYIQINASHFRRPRRDLNITDFSSSANFLVVVTDGMFFIPPLFKFKVVSLDMSRVKGSATYKAQVTSLICMRAYVLQESFACPTCKHGKERK